MLEVRIPILFLVGALLASCLRASPTASVTPAAPTSPSTILSPTATASTIRYSTPTRSPSPVKPTTTSTLVVPPETVLKYQRLDIASDLPPDAIPAGILILFGKQSHRLNFDQRVQQEISSETSCFSTSPDGRWLAYCQFSDNPAADELLIVESADGQQQKNLPIGQDWYWFSTSTWLDNQRLVFNLWKDRSVIPMLYPVVVVNPFTGEQRKFSSDYPDLKPSMVGPAGTIHFIYSTVVYDPSLNLVVYPQTTKDGKNYVVLWDRQAQKAVARVEELGVFLHTPLWSPDGKQFVVAVEHQVDRQHSDFIEEWFGVSREGQVQQLSHLGDFFVHTEIGAANWSPGGQRLAFWLDAKPSRCEGQNLAVLEMETQQVTDYCIPGSIHGDAPPPIWSPDSRYIAVQNYYDTNASHAILVDTKQGWAAQVSENAMPVGWLAEP